jgi:nucleoside-diphosphate-sugar epimerase
MPKTALVVGGTGPTGPHIVAGLRERDYEVTLFHRGVHELPEHDDLEHIHADPHFQNTIEEALGGRRFDLVIATYGRLRHVAAALAGFCDFFIGVTGIAGYRGVLEPASTWPYGLPVLADEDSPSVEERTDEMSKAARFAHAIRSTERAVLELHQTGAFKASLFRYCHIYGPRQVYPSEWSIVKRVLDGREFLIVPDGGLFVNQRCAAPNAAHFLMLAVDNPDAAAGEIFNVGDALQFTFRQWVQMLSSFAGRELEIISLPFDLAGPGRDIFALEHDQSCLLSVEKAKSLLGYDDIVSPAEFVQQTVAWYVEHPPADEVVAGVKDRFDYDAEDELVERYRDATSEMAAAWRPARPAVHSYPHPKAPGGLRDERGR